MRHKDKPLDKNDPNVKDRKCLRCSTMFLSTWSGNRVCLECKPLFTSDCNSSIDIYNVVVSDSRRHSTGDSK